MSSFLFCLYASVYMFPLLFGHVIQQKELKNLIFISLINILLHLVSWLGFFFFSENKEIAIKVHVYKICRNGDYDICMNLEVPAKCVSLGAKGKWCVGHGGVLVLVVSGTVGWGTQCLLHRLENQILVKLKEMRFPWKLRGHFIGCQCVHSKSLQLCMTIQPCGW